jgi:hypothetical protein
MMMSHDDDKEEEEEKEDQYLPTLDCYHNSVSCNLKFHRHDNFYYINSVKASS